LVAGNCNEKIGDVLAAIPGASSQERILSLCFVDPHDLSIKFSTISGLATKRMDFLFLLALHMDANRNVEQYINPQNPKIDEFLGISGWRESWEAKKLNVKFPEFLAMEFSERMTTLGYLPQPFHRMKLVRSDVKNLPLYHLALFSKANRAYEFWEKVLALSTDQRSFDFE